MHRYMVYLIYLLEGSCYLQIDVRISAGLRVVQISSVIIIINMALKRGEKGEQSIYRKSEYMASK